ncbi:DUF305 domain-containing protein [Parasphingorhabdus sp.]|uniref:CopM family metallochaperone n=1 Tax=Parasphingorhabdus sp. TaxID=2709688 RepID=UPI0032664533
MMTISKAAIMMVPALLLAGCVVVNDNADEAETGIAADETAEMEQNEAQKAYEKANAKMHVGMGVIDADPDIAFMQGMVPHHQGAVDMAEIVLKHGKDPETRALAESVIASQTREIAQMNAWLEKRGIETAAPEMVDHQAMGH